MEQLFKQEDLIGKTITQTIMCDDEVWIKFTDESFVVIDIKTEYGPGFGGYNHQRVVISECEMTNTSQPLVDLGLITKKDYDFAWEQEEIKTQARIKERDEEMKKDIEIHEREQLKELELKYKKDAQFDEALAIVRKHRISWWTEFSYYLPSWIRYHYVPLDGHQILWPRWGFTKKENAAADKRVEELMKSSIWE